MAHPYFDLPRPIAMGHRGAAGECPENTIVSFERALAQGAGILESDVQVTSDGVPVLLHDPEVDRTTDGAGPVREISFDALARLDAGHHFTADGGRSFPWRGRGVRVPSVEEAFRSLPAARFNLEIKDDANDLVEAVVALVRRLGREDRTLLTAGEPPIMERLLAALGDATPTPAIGASTADVLAFVRAALDGKAPAGPAMALQIPPDFLGRPLITKQLVDHAHAHGVHVHAWTINDPEEADRLLTLGVDGLISDFPELMRERIDEHRGGG